MSIKDLRDYLAMCECLNITPTWEGLSEYKQVLAQ